MKKTLGVREKTVILESVLCVFRSFYWYVWEMRIWHCTGKEAPVRESTSQSIFFFTFLFFWKNKGFSLPSSIFKFTSTKCYIPFRGVLNPSLEISCLDTYYVQHLLLCNLKPISSSYQNRYFTKSQTNTHAGSSVWYLVVVLWNWLTQRVLCSTLEIHRQNYKHIPRSGYSSLAIELGKLGYYLPPSYLDISMSQRI